MPDKRTLQLSELRDHSDNKIVQLLQGWNDRLDWPPTKLFERYIRNQLAVALELKCKIYGRHVWVHVCITNELLVDFLVGNEGSGRVVQDDLTMFVPNVHFVNRQERRNVRVRNVVRLNITDESEHIGIKNSLYFSVILGKTRFLAWPFFKDRTVDKFGVLVPLGNVLGEMPHNVVETGAKVVNDFSCQNPEAWRNDAVLMIGDCLVRNLTVGIGEDGVFAALDKRDDLGIEIADVLVGPF